MLRVSIFGIHTNDLRCLAQTRPVPPFLPGPQQIRIEPFPFVRLSFEYVYNMLLYFMQKRTLPVTDWPLGHWLRAIVHDRFPSRKYAKSII